MALYQRSDRPGGGNTRKFPELNEIASTTITGNIK
jgi:hypothetical protein